MKYYIIAGEASGDLHGSNLIKGLKNCDKDCDIRFWGGDLMAEAAGHRPVVHYKEGAIMGFWEVFRKSGALLSNLSKCKKDIAEWKPDAVILIDYPGFNMRIAKFSHTLGIKTLYYIAPKVWGWKESRIKKIQKYIDRLFIIFPFEIEYFKRKGVPATYVGNPLIDSINSYKYSEEDKEDFARRHGLDGKKLIAMLPGSRKGEISTMMPVLLRFMEEMLNRGYDDFRYVIAGAPSMSEADYLVHIERYRLQNPDSKISDPDIIFGETYSILRHAEVAVVNSGTASLETAIIGTPQLVGYIANELSYQIAKRIVKLSYISLGNLILDKGAFKEFIQHDCTPHNLAEETSRLLEDKEYRDRMIADYDEIRNRLGGPGASERVASEVIRYMKK